MTLLIFPISLKVDSDSVCPFKSYTVVATGIFKEYEANVLYSDAHKQHERRASFRWSFHILMNPSFEAVTITQ